QEVTGGAQHLERAHYVHRIEAQEIVAGNRVEVGVVGELGGAGVVEESVDAAVGAGGLGDALAGRVVGDVALHHHRLGSLGADHRGGLVGRVLIGGVVDDHRLGAPSGDIHSDRLTQARSAAGDDHDVVLEILAA